MISRMLFLAAIELLIVNIAIKRTLWRPSNAVLGVYVSSFFCAKMLEFQGESVPLEATLYFTELILLYLLLFVFFWSSYRAILLSAITN